MKCLTNTVLETQYALLKTMLWTHEYSLQAHLFTDVPPASMGLDSEGVKLQAGKEYVAKWNGARQEPAIGHWPLMQSTHLEPLERFSGRVSSKTRLQVQGQTLTRCSTGPSPYQTAGLNSSSCWSKALPESTLLRSPFCFDLRAAASYTIKEPSTLKQSSSS